MLSTDFNHNIDFWITALDQYNFTQLCAKPSSNNWSLGQVYMHLIDDSYYYIEQIKICLAVNEYAAEQASPTGRKMLLNNDFPDEQLEGSPVNSCMAQPDSKKQLRNDLLAIKAEMKGLSVSVAKSSSNGKTQHPGLGYFSAKEWFQFADMHLRHHLRQKKRIDVFLDQPYTS